MKRTPHNFATRMNSKRALQHLRMQFLSKETDDRICAYVHFQVHYRMHTTLESIALPTRRPPRILRDGLVPYHRRGGKLLSLSHLGHKHTVTVAVTITSATRFFTVFSSSRKKNEEKFRTKRQRGRARADKNV